MNFMNWLSLTKILTILTLTKGQIQQTNVLSNTVLASERIAAISVDKNGSNLVAGLYRGGNHIHVQKYERNDDEWQEIGGEITFNNACTSTQCGKNLAISGDGNMFAVGRMLVNRSRGRVHIFEWLDNDWELLQTIQGTDQHDRFGNSVSLSENGEILVVGGFRSNQGSSAGGLTKIFKRENNAWTQLGQTLFGGTNDFLGWSTAISTSGSVIAVGSYSYSDNFSRQGLVTIYDLEGDTLIARPAIYGLRKNAYFGSSVALSADGNVVAVGAIGDGPGRSGELKIFQYTGSSWDQIGQDINGLSSHGGSGNFGMHLSLSHDGKRVVGVDNRLYLIKGYVYDDASDNWIQFHSEEKGSQYRYVVAGLSGDGETLICGDTSNNGASGTLSAMRLSTASTESPTIAPTEPPTLEPSAYPSALPSISPTQFPTQFPTLDQWEIGRASVEVDSFSETMYISHEIMSIPDSAEVSFYESDCQTPLSSDIIFLDFGPNIGQNNITYDIFVDLIEANSSSAIYFDSDSTGFFYFCSDLVTKNDNGDRLGFSRSLYNVNINFANFSFSVSSSSDAIEQIDVNIEFSVSACECDENYECTDNLYHQAGTAPILDVCIFPDNPNTEITNFNLKLKSTLSNYVYDPVQIGSGGPVSDALTSLNENGRTKKVSTRIIEGLFDGGGEIMVSGVVVVGIVGKQQQPQMEAIELRIKVTENEEQGGCFNNLFTRISGFFF